MTQVVVTHDMQLAKGVEHVCVLDDGRVVEQGEPGEVLRGPSTSPPGRCSPPGCRRALPRRRADGARATMAGVRRKSRFSRADRFLIAFGAVVGVAVLVLAAFDVRRSRELLLKGLPNGLGLGLFLGLYALRRRWGFDLERYDELVDRWELSAALAQTQKAQRSRSRDNRTIGLATAPLLSALQGDLPGFQRALAAAIGHDLAEASWVVLGRAVVAARKRDWPLVLELLEDVTLHGLDEPRLALAEALLSWARDPLGAPQAPLKPAVICARAELDDVRRVWPELIDYLTRRPPGPTLN